MKAFKKTLALFLAFLMIASTGVALTFNTAADTATEFEPSTDGKYYINDADDFKAFVAEANKRGSVNVDGTVLIDPTKSSFFGEEVYLTDDIDLSGTTYTSSLISAFYGTLDGQGHSIKGLTINGASKNASLINNFSGTIRNISFTGVSIKSTVASSADIALIRYITHSSLFENVYLSGSVDVNGRSNIAGLVSRLHPSYAAMTATFNNCVVDCEVKCAGTGGGGNALFLGNTGLVASTVNFTDCVARGKVSHVQVTAGFVGFGTSNMNFTRCVSVADVTNGAYNGAFVFLDHQARTDLSTVGRNVNLTDCYMAYTGTAENVTASNSISASPGRGFGFNVVVNFGGKEIFRHTWVSGEVKAGGVCSRQADLNAKIDASGMCIARADAANVTTANYNEKCALLAESGKWLLTSNGTVAYRNTSVPEFLPKTVANMLGKTALAGPTDAKALQVRDNGDTYDVRIVGTVNFADADAYDAVGFDYVVKVKGAETNITSGNFETTKVFSSITANGETVNATDPEIGAKGFNLIEFYEFGDDGVTYEITVLSYAKKDDVKTYNFSGAFTVCVKDGALAN